MIIFVNKSNGQVIGKVDGRVHSEHVLQNVWIGDKNTTEKIIVEWKKTGKEYLEQKTQSKYIKVNEENNIYKKVDEVINVKVREREPDHPQKKLFADFEKNKKNIFEYKMDKKTKSFIKV